MKHYLLVGIAMLTLATPYMAAGESWMPRAAAAWPVSTENSIRVDHVSESPNVSDDDRSVLPLPGPLRLAVQVEEPT